MLKMLYDEDNETFYSENSVFDTSNASWHTVTKLPRNLIELTKPQAIKKLQQSKARLRIPIGVIGTNKPTQKQYQLAESIGIELGALGINILCGGRSGVMEAVCKGTDAIGGISIGLLPESTIVQANQFVSIPLATGIGFARGSLIATASFCLIAIGGDNGTLAEVASGLQFGKKIFAIDTNFSLPDISYCKSIEEIIAQIFQLIFSLE